ncbi:MAG: hypothetical protein R2710_08465 [Acidimicrobiales bacterium]
MSVAADRFTEVAAEWEVQQERLRAAKTLRGLASGPLYHLGRYRHGQERLAHASQLAVTQSFDYGITVGLKARFDALCGDLDAYEHSVALAQPVITESGIGWLEEASNGPLLMLQAGVTTPPASTGRSATLNTCSVVSTTPTPASSSRPRSPPSLPPSVSTIAHGAASLRSPTEPIRTVWNTGWPNSSSLLAPEVSTRLCCCGTTSIAVASFRSTDAGGPSSN